MQYVMKTAGRKKYCADKNSSWGSLLE